MCESPVSFWKRLWRRTTSECLSEADVLAILGDKHVQQQLRLGLSIYKPHQASAHTELQKKHPDQSKLLHIAQTLESYIDLDAFQTWDVIMHYLCDVSYGTPDNALRNLAFLDTRTSHLLPNIWNFYLSERLFQIKLLKYVIEFKDDSSHKYSKQFAKIIGDIGMQEIKSSLLIQLRQVMSASAPTRRLHSEVADEVMRREWALFNLLEQAELLQLLLLVVHELSASEAEFSTLFDLFRKHDYGKKQYYSDILEERHREATQRIMYLEVVLFLVIVDATKMNSSSCWIENTKKKVEGELCKLQLGEEHGAMLLAWMLLTLQSEQHRGQFEGHYQQFGSTALRLQVFNFLHRALGSSLLSDKSKCASIARQRVFDLLNEMCDRFDADGSLGHQPYAMELCGELLKDQDLAEDFWALFSKDHDCGMVSIWNTALEFFPYNFKALSTLAQGLAEAGVDSAKNLMAELKSLPVFTELYRPDLVPVAKLSSNSDDVMIGRDYFPLGNSSYRVDAGSKAAVMERKEGTFIHFRTPYSYWTIFNNNIEKILDRKVHNEVDINLTLSQIWEGAKLLKAVLGVLVSHGEVPRGLVAPAEGVFDVLVAFARSDAPPLPLLVTCLEVCTQLVPLFPNEIHSRLINTGLIPRLANLQLTYKEYASGATLDSAAVGSYLVSLEQPSGTYSFLGAYIDMLCAFCECASEEKMVLEILLPGAVLVLREVFPGACGWRYSSAGGRRELTDRCLVLLARALRPPPPASPADLTLQRTALYSLLHTENAVQLLRIVAVGDEQLQRMMCEEPSWVWGAGVRHLAGMQRALSVLMQLLRLKPLLPIAEPSPLERLVFAREGGAGALRVVPRLASYVNHAFNKHLPELCCRLLNIFAMEFEMSLFACLDMTQYQVRVMFLDRLRDKYESESLKVAILELVATCVGKQPALTEAFFKLRHAGKMDGEKVKAEEMIKSKDADDSSEGILTYMAEYLGTVKTGSECLHSPLLSCILALFHALWKNNMQILVLELRENPKFWEHMTSPLFNEIQPELKAYSQIFNILGIELFTARGKIEPSLQDTLETFFNTDKKHLDKWIDYVFSFNGRQEEEAVDRVPTWLSLLTSWKDFTTVFCKCLPISLNIAHKAKLVAPCMTTLLSKLEEVSDSRLVVILSELYVIMLANWKDDCFENRKKNVKQINELLTRTAIIYECLHPRAQRAILSIGTVAISTLDYEIKANSAIAQSIIRSVTKINSLELDKLFADIKEGVFQSEPNVNGATINEDIAPVVLSLAMLEQCLEIYDDMFSSLAQWFQSTKFVNKLLCCLHTCLQTRKHLDTSLAALRCLTAYARGPFSKDLLFSDVDQFLWLQLLPPKFSDEDNTNGNKKMWKASEWWRVYAYSLDFISVMVMKHGPFFASDAITFVGVHQETLVAAVLLPRQAISTEALNLCASALNLIVQLVKYEARWRMENINSMTGVMRAISSCLCVCVTLALRARRLQPLLDTPPAPQPPSDDTAHTSLAPHHSAPALNRILEIIHMSTLCLLSFSPDLLSLLADPYLDLERWQPLVEIHFGAPKISYEPFPQLTFGTLMSAIGLLARSLNHWYHTEESGARSPRRRRQCACGSPGDARRLRSDSLTSISSSASAAPVLAALDERLVRGALEAVLALLASQALLAVRDPAVPARHKQLVRRELSSELTPFYDFVRKRILCLAHGQPHLVRNKLGVWPLARDEDEARLVAEARRGRSDADDEADDGALPPPPPPKRPSTNDSMREFILRKQYLDKCATTPTKTPEFSPPPMSHSTPTADKKSKDVSRSSKRVSWAESTHGSDEDGEEALPAAETVYSSLTDVQVNNDEDYFHFMSVVFLYICQTDL